MIFKRFFRKKRSSKIAKERLEILLVTDRIGCNPHITESIKRDIVNVISKYIEIDIDHCVVEIHHEKGPCLMANIPIKEVKV